MVSELNRLSADERELIYMAPILVCILIAGADGEIDRKEIQEAIRLADRGRSRANASIAALFREIAQDFEDKIRVVIQQYPYEPAERNTLVVEELTRLNKLWPKIDPDFSALFYKTLLEIAHKIARSSGGMLGYKKVAAAEAQYLDLGMIKDPSTL